MNDTITLLADTAKHKKGSVLRVWRPGIEPAADVVDPQRASQWIEDGVAIAGAEVKAARVKAPAKATAKAPRKRGK